MSCGSEGSRKNEGNKDERFRKENFEDRFWAVRGCSNRVIESEIQSRIFSNGKFQLEGRWGGGTTCTEKTRITPKTTRRETERDSNREYISRDVSEFGQTRSGRRIDYSASFSAANILRNRYACMRAERSQRATKPTRCVCIRETRGHRNTRLGPTIEFG